LSVRTRDVGPPTVITVDKKTTGLVPAVSTFDA